jgi:predicted RecA/RadA family phage recombinase
MTALAQSRHDERQTGDIVDVLHNGNAIFQGGAVVAHTDGFAKAGVAARPFLGVALENTPDDKDYIRVQTNGVYAFAAAGLVQGDVGKSVILADDQTVALATGGAGEVVIGKIFNVESATKARVRITV